MSSTIVHFLTLTPIDLTVGDFLKAHEEGNLIDTFKLMPKPAKRMTHAEITKGVWPADQITRNEATRLMNVGTSRQMEVVFNDTTFSESMAGYLGAFMFSKAKRTADYRVGIRLALGETIIKAIASAPALASTKITAQLKINGGSSTTTRRITGIKLFIDANSTDFGLTAEDVEKYRRSAASLSVTNSGLRMAA